MLSGFTSLLETASWSQLNLIRFRHMLCDHTPLDTPDHEGKQKRNKSDNKKSHAARRPAAQTRYDGREYWRAQERSKIGAVQQYSVGGADLGEARGVVGRAGQNHGGDQPAHQRKNEGGGVCQGLRAGPAKT